MPFGRKPRTKLNSAALALVGAVLLPSAAPAGPNVVVILTDDQRWDCVGSADRPYLGIRTPNLDRLAAEGARFRNAFVTTSLCSPSRASMLSGLYAHTHQVINNFTDFPADLPSYPRQLQAAGYETAYIGKFHMGEQSDEKRPGFDYWISHTGQGRYDENTFNIDGTRKVVKGYYTKVVTDMAVEWLRGRGDRPFLLVLGHKAPHGPFVPEEKYRHAFDAAKIEYPASAFDLAGKPRWIAERLDTWHGIYGPLYGFRNEFPDRSGAGVKVFGDFVRSYLGTILSVDDSVGAICHALKETGRLEDTVIIFTSDNGFLLGEHGMIDKRTMHEESIRVPLLVRYPKRIRPGSVIDEMVLNIDLAPSIVELCGAAPLPKVHGRSWAVLLERTSRAGDHRPDPEREQAGRAGAPGTLAGASGSVGPVAGAPGSVGPVAGAPGSVGWRTSWYYEYDYEKQFPYTPNVRGVRTADWKYVHYPHGDGKPDRHKAELYNLRADPQERKNLIDDPACADRLADLRAELARLMNECDALPDKMPLDEGVKMELPEKAIR